MSQVDDCVGIINQTIASFKPEVGLILGSGLGQFCDNINTIASPFWWTPINWPET